MPIFCCILFQGIVLSRRSTRWHRKSVLERFYWDYLETVVVSFSRLWTRVYFGWKHQPIQKHHALVISSIFSWSMWETNLIYFYMQICYSSRWTFFEKTIKSWFHDLDYRLPSVSSDAYPRLLLISHNVQLCITDRFLSCKVNIGILPDRLRSTLKHIHQKHRIHVNIVNNSMSVQQLWFVPRLVVSRKMSLKNMNLRKNLSITLTLWKLPKK